jgi:Amt family ammonium transporter
MSTSLYPPASVPQWLSLGSNAWVLAATTFVMIQSIPALAVFYAGLTRRRFALNTAMMVLYSFTSAVVVWMLLGYGLSFYSSSITLNGFHLLGLPLPVWYLPFLNQTVYGPSNTGLNIPLYTFIMFQFAFAAITPALIVGAIVERFNFKAWLLYSPLWVILVYSPVAYWMFAGGWLNQLHAVDYAGGYVIHMTAGFAALALAGAVGPRRAQEMRVEAHNLLVVMIGFGLDWVGWNGFNGGAAGGATLDAALAILNTNFAAAAAAMVWMALDMRKFKRASFVGMASGAFSGLVGITPMAGLVNPGEALLTGLLAGTLCWSAMYKLLPVLRVDDALGVFPIHGVGGVVGGLLTGLFIDPAVASLYLPGYRGALFGDPWQLWVQGIAVIAVAGYSLAASYLLAKVVKLIVPLRLSEEEIRRGDMAVHGETAYSGLAEEAFSGEREGEGKDEEFPMESMKERTSGET